MLTLIFKVQKPGSTSTMTTLIEGKRINYMKSLFMLNKKGGKKRKGEKGKKI